MGDGADDLMEEEIEWYGMLISIGDELSSHCFRVLEHVACQESYFASLKHLALQMMSVMRTECDDLEWQDFQEELRRVLEEAEGLREDVDECEAQSRH